MTPHACDACRSLYYPTVERPLRCDAVILTLDDRELPHLEEVARRRAAAVKGAKDRGGVEDRGPVFKRLLGVYGERLVARLLGLPFDEKPFGLDVGRYNVRTRGRLEWELIIQDHDVEHHAGVPYILVTADETWSVFIVRGWMPPAEAVRPEWRHAHGGYERAYFVPQAELHDLRRLPERGYA